MLNQEYHLLGPDGGAITMMRIMLLSGLIVAIFGANLWLAVMAGLSAGRANPAPIHQHVEPLHPVNSDLAKAFLVTYADSNDIGQPYAYVDVAVDEEFIEYFGDGWRNDAYLTIEGTNVLLSEVGFTVKVNSLGQWHSKDNVKFISSHIPHINQQIANPPRHLTLAITGQATTRDDGYVRLQDGVVIVQYDARRPRRIHSLIAHEIGHVIGVNHHDNEEECTEDGCIMDAEGYEFADEWCTHHKQEIEGKLAAILITD